MTEDTPSTAVIRHWVAWTYIEDCPDEFIDHDSERVRLFEDWLVEVKAQAWEEGKLAGWRDHAKAYQSTTLGPFEPNPYRQGENK